MSTDTDMSSAQIVAASGVDASNVSVFLSEGKQRGEVQRYGERGSYVFRLNENYTPGPARGKKLQGFKGARRTRQKAQRTSAERRRLRQIADQALVRPVSKPDAHALALASYVAAGEYLREHVQTNVEGISADPVLCMLLAMHQRAEQLLDAVQSA